MVKLVIMTVAVMMEMMKAMMVVMEITVMADGSDDNHGGDTIS